RTAHLTYYVLDQDSYGGYDFYKDNKELADKMSKVLGYNFTVSSAELITKDNSHTLNLTIKNTGVAPCFFDVYLVAEFIDNTGATITQIGKTVLIPKGTFKDDSSQDFSFTYKSSELQTDFSIALSLYENEEAYKKGDNPTVRFDNEGLGGNNKLVLIP
ncbi:MAG: DUF4832 domain-containing protein, partial [Bacteroidales bacterium]|nr:DUF4832 domain-containing protein [Bacteroidales bacterium]